MRNPDGTLVHPPKRKILTGVPSSQQHKSISNISNPPSTITNHLQPASQEMKQQEIRQLHSMNSSLADPSHSSTSINTQIPVKKKKMNIKSINSGQTPKSMTAPFNKGKKAQKVRPPGSIGLQPTTSIKLTSASQGKSSVTQVVSFSPSQGLATPTKGISPSDVEGMQQQVQLKTVDTSPNSMIKDLSQVKTAEERLRMLQDAVNEAMKPSVSRATQLQLPKSTTATKVTIGKQSAQSLSLQPQQPSQNVNPSNHRQSKPKSSSATSTPNSIFASVKRSSSPHVTSGSELKVGNEVTMTKSSTIKGGASSSFTTNAVSAKQSLDAVAEFAAAAQATQSQPFDLTQYIEMFTKTPSLTSINSTQSGKTATPSSTSTISAYTPVSESRNKSTLSPSPNSKLIQSANKAVSKTKQTLKVTDNSSNQHKRSSSASGDTQNVNRTTSSSLTYQSASTIATSARPKSSSTSSVPGGESRNKSSQSKNSSGSGSKQSTPDSSHFNEIYSQMQVALQRGDEKTYTHLISQLQASMMATSSGQSSSSPSTISSKTSSNSNSPSGNSVILKSEKAKGGNSQIVQSGTAKKPNISSNISTVAKPSVTKSATSNMSSNEPSVPALLIQSKSNQSNTNVASNLSIEFLTKQSTTNTINKSQISNNRTEQGPLASVSNSSISRENDSMPQKTIQTASAKQGLLTACTQQQKQPSSNVSVASAGTSVLKSQQTQQQRPQHQYQQQISSPNQQLLPQPQQQKKPQQQKTVQIMNVSSTVSKGQTSPQQSALPSLHYQRSPTTVHGHNMSSHIQAKPANASTTSTAVSQQALNYVQKPSVTTHQQTRVSSSPKTTPHTVNSLAYLNQGNIVTSSSILNQATVQQGNALATNVSTSRQIPVYTTTTVKSSKANIFGGTTSITTTSTEQLSSSISTQQQPKKLTAADTTQMLSSLQPCQPPAKLQIGVSSYTPTLMSTNSANVSSSSPQKLNRSPQNSTPNVSVTLPFSNQVSVTSPQFQANVIHVNQAPANQTNQNQPSFSTAQNLSRISVTQASVQRSQPAMVSSQNQLQQQLSSPVTLTPVMTSPVQQGYAKVSPPSYQHPQQISPNTRQVQQIISPSQGMSVTPIQQKTQALGLTIQQAGSSTMTSITPNTNRKLSPSSLPSTPAISITGITASSPMNVSLEAVNGGTATSLYNPSALQGTATITLPSVPAPMSFNSKNTTYQQPTQAQQIHQQQHALNMSNKTTMQNNCTNNLSMGGNSVRQIQMQAMPQQQQQVQSNMTAMYNTSPVSQQFTAYGGQQQGIAQPQGLSQQQGATLITVSPSHHQTVQINSPQFQGLTQHTASHVNIPIQQASQGATVSLQQQQHSSRGDLQTPPPFSFSYSQLTK